MHGLEKESIQAKSAVFLGLLFADFLGFEDRRCECLRLMAERNMKSGEHAHATVNDSAPAPVSMEEGETTNDSDPAPVSPEGGGRESKRFSSR